MPTSSDTSVRRHFDYNILDAADAIFIQQQANEIWTRRQRAAQDMLDIGERLIQVKARLRHGQFGAWLEAEVKISQDTAERLMNVAKFCKENPQYAEFADRFAPLAFYLITAPSTSKSVREEVLALAKAGEFISPKIARETKQKYSSPSPNREQEAKPQPEVKSQPRSEIQSAQASPSPADALARLPVSQLPTIPSAPDPAQARQRAIEMSNSESRIMAIRPQQLPQFNEEEETQPADLPTEKPPARFVQPGTWWQLGERHRLYCGDPTTQRFRERLPDQVALSLAFPPDRDEWPQAPSDKISSSLTWLTRFEQDQDFQTFWKMIECSLLLATNAGDSVVFSFLPYPDLLLLVHQLECRCYCAEPDPVRCEAAIRAMREQGFRTEKVTGLRF